MSGKALLAGLFLIVGALPAASNGGVSGTSPVPTDSRSSALGLNMRFRGLGGLTSVTADEVLFVRIEEGGDVGDVSQAARLIPSNHAHKADVYLLNVQPGTYVAVAAVKRLETVRFVDGESQFVRTETEIVTNYYYFARELIEQTMTTVEPASFAFMGKFIANIHVFKPFDEFDEIQRHIHQQIYPDAGSGNRIAVTIHESDHSWDAELEFRDKAKANFEKSEWASTTPWAEIVDWRSPWGDADERRGFLATWIERSEWEKQEAIRITKSSAVAELEAKRVSQVLVVTAVQDTVWGRVDGLHRDTFSLLTDQGSRSIAFNKMDELWAKKRWTGKGAMRGGLNWGQTGMVVGGVAGLGLGIWATIESSDPSSAIAILAGPLLGAAFGFSIGFATGFPVGYFRESWVPLYPEKDWDERNWITDETLHKR